MLAKTSSMHEVPGPGDTPVPFLVGPVRARELVRGSVGRVDPAAAGDHPKEVFRVAEVEVGVSAYEVGGFPDSGSGIESLAEQGGVVSVGFCAKRSDVAAGGLARPASSSS